MIALKIGKLDMPGKIFRGPVRITASSNGIVFCNDGMKFQVFPERFFFIRVQEVFCQKSKKISFHTHLFKILVRKKNFSIKERFLDFGLKRFKIFSHGSSGHIVKEIQE